tara:strand:- start:1044 stop:2549 length:1506 start_codon:yes stop_codon:yes gene_type:complete
MRDTSFKYSGEPTAKSLASGLATLGRYGDDYMVHAAEGETFVPKEILESNPELKANLFRQMTMMGIENPNRYVVGNELNSINPITGQPEFFFKKVFRAIKKVAKKVLPVAVPIIANYLVPGSGPFASALLTKAQGGSWADAAKAGAFSYAANAIGTGLQEGFSFGPQVEGLRGGLGGQPLSFLDRLGNSSFSVADFGKGVKSGLMGPFQAASNIFSSGPANPISQGGLGPKGIFGTNEVGLFPRYQVPEFGAAAAGAAGAGALASGDPSAVSAASASGQALPAGVTQTNGRYFMGDGTEIALNKVIPPGFSEVAPEGILSTLASKTGETLSGGNLTGTGAKVLGGAALAGGAYLAADASGILTPEEQTVADAMSQLDASNPRRAAYEQWQGVEDKNSPAAQSLKSTWYGTPSYSTAQLSNLYGANPIQGITGGTPGAPIVAAAGGEIMGPGTGTSDSIPARLSDGEFVMTARAVRNAGNGNRDLGAARMYDMMNRFESGAA